MEAFCKIAPGVPKMANMLEGGARLDLHRRGDYHEAEAREAFNRMVREHGWY